MSGVVAREKHDKNRTKSLARQSESHNSSIIQNLKAFKGLPELVQTFIIAVASKLVLFPRRDYVITF